MVSEIDSQIDRYAAGHDYSFRKAVDQSAEFLEKVSFSKIISVEFRRLHYDDPDSIFIPRGDFQDLLGVLLPGVITGSKYWTRSSRRQHWRSQPADPYRGGNYTPPFDGEITPLLRSSCPPTAPRQVILVRTGRQTRHRRAK